MDFRQVFPKRHTLLVVIHCENMLQTIRNVGIAQKEGADGVFLINHGIMASGLIKCYLAAKKEYGNFWVGVNFLDADMLSATVMARTWKLPGLWLDDAGYEEGAPDPLRKLCRLAKRQIELDLSRTTLIFGGTAFKYRPSVVNVAKAAQATSSFVDVVTTCGDRTGSPPDVEKIRLMKQAIGQNPLAIASGISAQNITDYLDCTDCFMVATSISISQSDLDPRKVNQLVMLLS